MEEYEKLQNNTRNLEQKYTVYKIAQLADKIVDLKEKLKNNSSKGSTLLENEISILKRNVADLEKKLEISNKDKAALEQALDEEKSKIDERSNDKYKENKSKNGTLEKSIKEIQESQKEANKSLKQLLKSIESKDLNVADDSYLNKKIQELEVKLEDLKAKNIQMEKNEKFYKEQKDSIVLLKESVESKEKTIQSQKLVIERLTEQLKNEKKLHNPFENDVIIPELKNENKQNQSNPWSISFPKEEQPVPKKKGTQKKDKNVNVENIFKEENKSFFNNLSFTNSSPIIGKKFKKNFK